MCVQANIPMDAPPEDWMLDSLAAKVGQYCFLLQNMTGEHLKAASQGDYERLRTFLHEQGREAYEEKVRHGEGTFCPRG
jgi:preprotein translocase subunit SecA